MILKKEEFLLYDKVYFSIAQVVRKKQCTFWIFVHDKKIIKKSDNTMSWLCGLYKEVGKIQFYSSISITSLDGQALDKEA